MTSATLKPAHGTGGHRAEGHGLVIFASVLLLVLACFNLIDLAKQRGGQDNITCILLVALSA